MALTPKALSDETKRWPFEWLMRIARWPHEHNTWLGPTAVFANGEPPKPFAKNTKLSCIFAAPAGYDFSTWQRPDGQTVTIYQLYPIYTEERDLEREEGAEELLGRLMDADLPLYVDPKRENVA